MTRRHLPDIFAVIVLGVIGGGAIAAVAPAAPVQAQTRAERTCMDHGVFSNSPAYEQCVSRVTRAFEWGEPEVAYTLARISRDARSTCLSYGIQAQSLGYQSCIDREISARSELVFTDDQTDTGAWSATLASQ